MEKEIYICKECEKLLKKAERNIDELLDEEEDKRIKLDITKFVAERLGSQKTK